MMGQRPGWLFEWWCGGGGWRVVWAGVDRFAGVQCVRLGGSDGWCYDGHLSADALPSRCLNSSCLSRHNTSSDCVLQLLLGHVACDK